MKTKYNIIFIIFLFQSITQLFAQQNAFTKVLYDNNGAFVAYSLLKSSGDDFLISGQKDDLPFIIKMDNNGDILWSKQVESCDGVISKIVQADDTTFYAVGHIWDNSAKLIFLKFNLAGDMLRSKAFEEENYTHSTSISRTFDYGFIVRLTQFVELGEDYHSKVIKLDSLLNIEWQKKVFTSEDFTYVNCTRQTPDTGYILSGISFSTPSGEAQFLIGKLSSSGEVEWAKSYAHSYPFLEGFDIAIHDDGYLFLNDKQIAFIKTDFDGNFMWGKQTTCYLSANEYGGFPEFRLTNDGNYIFYFTHGMMKTDPIGNVIWAQDLFLNTIDVSESSDGGVMAIGNGPMWGVSMTETLNPQIGIIKMDALGNSTGCVYSSAHYSNEILIELVPYTLNTIPATFEEISQSFSFVEPFIAVDSGCVAFIGDVHEFVHQPFRMNVSPNPSQGVFRISFNKRACSGHISLNIYSPTGERIQKTISSDPQEAVIDLGDYPNGIYYIMAMNEDEITSQKIIILR